jgi:hypothetical protein
MRAKRFLSFILLFLSAAFCSPSVYSQQIPREKVSDRWEITHASGADRTNAGATPKLTPIVQKTNAVCPDPAKPCQHKDKQFDAWELPFRMPARLRANKPYKSAAFYAVIIKTYETDEDCDGGEYIEALELERKNEQKKQPSRKVFAYYSCPNMAAVGYDFDGMWSADRERVLIQNFIAVYAGETKQEGEAALKSLKNKYPQASLKQMTAIFENIVQ